MSDPMRVHSRRLRSVAVVWFAAGVVLTSAALLLALADERLGVELLLGPVALLVAWRLWLVRCTVDEHGIEAVGLRSRRRFMWSALDAVEFAPGTSWGVPVRVVPRGRGAAEAIESTWGLSRNRRAELLAAVGDHAGRHGVDLRSADA